MSSLEAQLKEQVADLLSMSSEAVTSATSLDSPRFRSSAGAMILQSVIRSVTGKTLSTVGVRNFGELVERATGEVVVDSSPSTGEVSAPILVSDSLTSPGGSGFGAMSCGVDIEDVATMPDCPDFWSHDFYTTNFTSEEIAYCVTHPEPRVHFAARWCAKEALKKSSTGYMSLSPADIQVVRHPAGNVSLQVRVAGEWRDTRTALSLSHTEHSAIAMVILQVP